ncbi:hypothetical protein FRC08_006745 [Ceratobasidium sp. 394]|nr:hypothetical protein FRC08_006745 [Ceratobasidium sp. 394]
MSSSRPLNDTSFTTRARRNKRQMYDVDLSSNALPLQQDSAASAVVGPSVFVSGAGLNDVSRLTQTWKVERVCHRESMRGRTAIILHALEQVERQPVQEEPLGIRDFELKLTWEHPGEMVEGEVLERSTRVYGVGRHKWYGDTFKAYDHSSYGRIVNNRCGDRPDSTPSWEQACVTENLVDRDIEIPEEESKETQCKAAQTGEYSQGGVSRTSRIYCRLSPSTVGSPLCSAESPRQLLQAVLGAILGYWGLMNSGLFPPDINNGNVLMLKEEQGYHKRDRKAPRSTTSPLDPGLVEAERSLREVLDRLDRAPTGMLYDLDLFTAHGDVGAAFCEDLSWKADEREVDEPEAKRRKLNSGTAASITPGPDRSKVQGTPGGSSLTHAITMNQGACRVIDFRTRISTFMSTRALHVVSGQHYPHHFTDDLESFFWLILWCVAEHVDSEDSQPTAGALGLLNSLNPPSLTDIATAKSCLLAKSSRKGLWMRDILASCNNSWATDLAVIKIVLALGNYFYDIFIDLLSLECNPGEVFPTLVEVIMSAINA